MPTDKKLEQFSVGMKAKLKLITAICHKAKLLILDEPTAGLDVMARNEMLDMLRDYMEEDEERSDSCKFLIYQQILKPYVIIFI